MPKESITSLIDWLIPESFKENQVIFYKAQVYIVLSLLSLLSLIVLSTLDFFNIYGGNESGLKFYHVGSFFALLICFGFYCFKRWELLSIGGNVFLFAVFMITASLLPNSGGLYSADVSWLLLAPIFGFLLFGIRTGFLWTGVSMAVIIGLFYLERTDGVDYKQQLAAFSDVDVLIDAIALLVIMVVIIYNFVKIHSVLINELSERRQVIEEKNEELLRTQAALEQSNKALERYAYVTSHDLQQPLKTIEGLSQVLGRHLDKKGQLDTQTTELVAYINKSVQNMDHLITDLLDVSRKNHLQQQIQACDLNELLDNVLHNLSNAIQKEEVAIQKEELPKLSVIPIQITQVFQNLISNAIKFKDPKRPLKIHVSAHEMERCWEFSIKDNGKGIEKQYLQSIFEPFNKLDETVQGSGIGLDTCSKIIAQHGGTIWADSDYGLSTTFYFTIEKNVVGATLVVARDVVGTDPSVCPDGEDQTKP